MKKIMVALVIAYGAALAAMPTEPLSKEQLTTLEGIILNSVSPEDAQLLGHAAVIISEDSDYGEQQKALDTLRVLLAGIFQHEGNTSPLPYAIAAIVCEEKRIECASKAVKLMKEKLPLPAERRTTVFLTRTTQTKARILHTETLNGIQPSSLLHQILLEAIKIYTNNKNKITA